MEPAPRTVALVVDGNATSRRFVELALERTGQYSVEAAKDVASARELLKGTSVDIIVSDTDLADMSGLAFLRKLSEESRLRGVPFIFLSADRSVDTKIATLRAGASDYIVKPCDVAELVTRVDVILDRQRAFRKAVIARTTALSGEISMVSIPDLVGIVETGKRSGTLSIVTETVLGRLYFDRGQMVHATCGNLSGTDAFYRLYRETTGNFEFEPTDGTIRAPCTIHGSITTLLLEASRLLDRDPTVGVDDAWGDTTSAVRSHEVRADDAPPTTRPPPPDYRPDRTTTRPPPPSYHLDAPLKPDVVLAAQFELALRDPFSLGDLCVWTESELSRWTREELGRDRMHVMLVADMAAGVSAMLALGAAPTERWVLDSLQPKRKTFGLSFHLRNDRVIDLVLLDITTPTAVLSALQRSPSAMIVAPPQGSLVGISASARVSLTHLIEVVAPPAVVGVGTTSLKAELAAVNIFEKGSLLRCTTGVLGESGEDLRGLLIKAVRLWSSSPGGPGPDSAAGSVRSSAAGSVRSRG